MVADANVKVDASATGIPPGDTPAAVNAAANGPTADKLTATATGEAEKTGNTIRNLVDTGAKFAGPAVLGHVASGVLEGGGKLIESGMRGSAERSKAQTYDKKVEEETAQQDRVVQGTNHNRAADTQKKELEKWEQAQDHLEHQKSSPSQQECILAAEISCKALRIRIRELMEYFDNSEAYVVMIADGFVRHCLGILHLLIQPF